MIAQCRDDVPHFMLSRSSFDTWCEDYLRDPYCHRILAVDTDRSWPRYKARVEEGLQRCLARQDWTLTEGADDGGLGDPQAIAVFLTVVRQTKRDWPTWRITPSRVPDQEAQDLALGSVCARHP